MEFLQDQDQTYLIFEPGPLECTQSPLDVRDQYIFFVGGSLVLIATFTLMISSLMLKGLKDQVAGLVFGIAFADFLLAVQWLITAAKPSNIGIDSFCQSIGGVATFAGTNELLYNICFCLHLRSRLKNALKQNSLPTWVYHLGIWLFSAFFLTVMYSYDNIGRTMVGTCSIKAPCVLKTRNFLAPVIVLAYTFIGGFTIGSITRNASLCAQTFPKITENAKHYRKFIIASTIIYTVIAAFSFLQTILQGDTNGADSQKNPIIPIVNTFYNISKLCSPLFLTYYRFSDPHVLKNVKMTFPKLASYFIKQKQVQDAKQVGLLNGNISGAEDQEQGVVSSVHSVEAAEDDYAINLISETMRQKILFTLLSCVHYAEYIRKNPVRRISSILESHAKNVLRHQKIAPIIDEDIKAELPEVGVELKKAKIDILPGSLKMYAPEIFGQFVAEDKEYLDIQQSLNFSENSEEIKSATTNAGGKSGEFFLSSKDKKLIIKTIPDVEMRSLIRIIGEYDEHLKTYPNSLIAKLYGLYTFDSTDVEQKINIIVMKNVCGMSSRFVECCYDMKGSTYDREVFKGQENVSLADKKKQPMKDLDFKRFEGTLHIDEELKDAVREQIRLDSEFFRRVKLIDYSFMVFMTERDNYLEVNGENADEFTAKNKLACLRNTERPGMYYKLGIVDFLQPYNFQKMGEKYLKKIKKRNWKLDTSSQNPEYYSERFIKNLTAYV